MIIALENVGQKTQKQNLNRKQQKFSVKSGVKIHTKNVMIKLRTPSVCIGSNIVLRKHTQQVTRTQRMNSLRLHMARTALATLWSCFNNFPKRCCLITELVVSLFSNVPVLFPPQLTMPTFPVVVKIGHAHSGMGKVQMLLVACWESGVCPLPVHAPSFPDILPFIYPDLQTSACPC